jgi:hypothetical protein
LVHFHHGLRGKVRHTSVFNINGESYRMRSHRARAETLRNAATTRNT